MSQPWSIRSWFGKSRSERARGRKARRSAAPRPTATARPDRRTILLLEALEDRLAPAAVSWTGSAGDNLWGDAGNWSNGVVPGSADDVTISKSGVGTITIGAGTFAVRSLNDTTASLSIALNGSLSLAAVAATSTFGQNVTVQPGATLTVGAGASVVINYGVTITDNGTLNVTSAAVAAQESGYTTFGIVVNGAMNATDTSFTHTSTYGSSALQVSAGGHLTASNSTFAWSSLTLANGSILNSGDITNNGFNQTISIPAIDAPLLANNLSFQDVDILPGSLTGGQSVTLTPIGTTTTVNQRYVFNATTGNFTVQAGATLNVNGAAMFAAETSYTTFGIVVNGTMNVTNGANFTHSSTYGSSALQVGAGGHLTASNSTFAWSSMTLASGSILNSGDLTANGFDLPISIPIVDAPLLANNRRFQDVDILPGSLSSGQSVTLAPLGTDTTVNQQYVFNATTGNFTVQAGATLNVSSGTAMVAYETSYTTFGIVVNGTMNVTGASFTHTSTYGSSALQVGAGGHLTTSGSTFAWSSMTLASGSILNSGDITNNGFNLPLSIPIVDAPLLANNLSFQDVDILPGSLTGGQSVTLTPIGTTTTVNQRYVFNATTGNFTVQAGATLNVNGAAMFAAETSYTTFGIVVNGTMNVTNGANFTHSSTYGSSALQVGAGGHLTASNSTFAWSSMTLASGSILNSGDLTANGFDLPISIPIVDAPLLANNRRFQDVDILPGSLSSGQSVTLAPLGTDTTVNQRYVFNATTGNFTVQAGATLNVNGAAMFAAETSYTTFGIVVNGTMNVTNGANFTHSSTYGSSALQVGAGGHLTASNSTFAWSSMTLASGSILNSGDITNNAFNLPLSVPITDVPLLTNNQSFEVVDISAGSLNNDQTVALNLMGTVTSVNLSYVFTGAVTVQAGATLNVAGNVPVLIQGGLTLTDNGTLTFGAGDAVSFANGTTQIVVGSGSAMTASGTAFSGSSSYITEIVVNNGGQLVAIGSTFALDNLTLSSGSGGTLQFDTFSSQYAINSGASFTINQNDLSNIPGSNKGIIASGSGSATINLNDNYWGTTDASQIAAKITDHNNPTSNPSLPTVSYQSPLGLEPTQTAAAAANVVFNTAAQNVTLSATVTSPSGVVSQGTETFTVLNGSNVVGNPVNANVNNGAASATYALPAALAPGTYTIQAVYNGTSYFASSSDTSHSLTVSAAAASTAAANASVTFNTAGQNAALSATVTSAAGTVNEGTETFTILSGSTVIGGPVTVNVSAGAASTNYTLPGGTPGGTYTIQAVYNGTTNFGASTDTSHSLTVNAAASSTASGNVSATYSVASQAVGLSATVTSAAGTVSEGTETFTILSGSKVVGSSVTVNVSAGAASANYTLPAATAPASYTIQAVYNGTGNYAGSSDSSHSLTVNTARTSTAAGNASATYSVASQSVTLGASVTSGAGTVNEGTETFTIFSGNSVTANVSNGAASKGYTLPAGTVPGTYTIQAVYNGTANFGGASDTTHSLTVNPAPGAAVSVSLDSNSDSGAPDYPGITNDKTPTFDVQVNQAGTITIDFDGNAAHDQTQTVSAAGTYQFTAPTLADGAYTTTAKFSAGLSGSAQNSTNYTIDTVPPHVTALTPSGTVNTTVSQATVTFSEPVDQHTFSPSAITLTGPNGAIGVNQPQLVSGSTYSIGFTTQTGQGAYSLVVAASVTDFAGNPIGHSSTDSFTIALPDLAVTSTSSPSSAAEGASIPVSWEVADVSPTNATGATWTDAVYLSAKAVLDDTAVRLTSVAGPSSPLAPGSSYARNVSVTLPGNLATGNYYLLFVANDNGGQLESDSADDTNDVVADAIALLAPDLQVTGVSGPASGITGQSVLVNWTDENTGTATATGPWVDDVYTGSDAAGDNPTLLGSFTFDGSLAVGASVQRTQQVILPQTAGTQWFLVTTNATRVVPESNYGNDTTVAAVSTTITGVPLPDLVVTSITPPANGVFSGNSVPVSFVVKNQGPAATSAPTWQDWVILSQDPNLAQTYQGQLNPTGPGGDQTLNNQPVILGFNNPSYLGVGDSYQQNVSVPLPINAEGTWYVYVVPDGTGAHHPFAMPEASRTDKLAVSPAFSVTLSPPPDLAVSGVQAPAQDFSGQPMKLSWTVTNTGTGPTATGAWTDAVYESTKATLDASATLLGTFAHQGVLAVGAGYTVNQTVALPVGVSGPYYFLVKTDLYGQVFQNGTPANNVAATAAAETVNLTPPPDLTVSSIAAPATALADHGFTFSYTVTNAGAGATPNYTWNDSLYLSPTATFHANSAIALGQQTHQGSLAAGAGYTNTVTVTLPNGLAGSYYVVVTTDSGDAVFELNRTNNTGVSTGATTVSQALPDLVVLSASAPATALAGSAILVNWTVADQSTGDTAVSAWQDSVYVATGSQLDNKAILLGSFEHYGLLSGGGSYSQSQLLTLPIDLLGNYNLFVVTNSAGDVYESNTSNNTSGPLPIAISLQFSGGGNNGGGGNNNGGGGNNGGGSGGGEARVSDLQPTAVTGPATALTGASVTVTWTVQDNGPGTTNANTWDDDVWMSTNTTLGSGGTDVYLGTVPHVNPLASGASYSAAGTFALPNDMSAGNYYFIVATDRPVAPPGQDDGVELVYETNYANNEIARGSTTAVTVGATPDLTVTGVTAPTTATSGQQLAVGWTVTNNGTSTGAVPITDSVYLSYDTVLDPTDRYLGSLTTQAGLAAGASYTQNATFALPAGLTGTFYVFVETNSNNSVFERNTADNSGYDTQPVPIQLPPPADLVAETVTVPPSAVAGQSVTVTYQVANNGGEPANGSWSDALYLSPTPTWNVSDPLLGTVHQTRNLAPGGSYTGTLTAPLPGVAPGAYYVILRANILDNIPEETLSNNEIASLTSMAIDAPALTLGTAANGTLTRGQSAYWKVVVGAGQTLHIGLTGHEAAAQNELYVSFGTMPTRSQYDYRYSQPFAANQQITVPTTQAGVYYILAYADAVPTPPESYALVAALVPFSIQAVAPNQAGTGPVTLQIGGAQFDFGTTFQLRNAAGTVLDATRTLLQDSATAFATFDLAGQAQGFYNVWAIQSDGTTTELAAGLNVVTATPNNSVQLGLIVPQAVLVGRPGTVTVTYANPGNTDVPAPLILLDGQNALFQVPGQTAYSSASLQLFGFNSAGPFGTLPPGFQGSISVSFTPIAAGAGIASTFTISTLQDPSEPFDWSAVAANDLPTNTSPEQWAAMVSQAAALMGNTWGSVVSFLGNDSVQLLANVAGQANPAEMNGLYNFDGLLQYVIGVYGSASPGNVTPPFPVVASEGDVTLYNASGKGLPLNASYPTFVIVPGVGGYQDDYGALAAAIAADSAAFPNGQVNVLVATWQGATAGPTLDGLNVPWVAALHVATDGTQLGDLLASLDQQGAVGISTTTVIAEGFGVDVGDQAAQIAGGLEDVLAFNPASPLGGYLPSTLQGYFQDSTAYETTSFLDAQLALAASNQTLDTGDVDNPILQHTAGVAWLTEQVLQGNDGLLTAGAAAGPDVLPAGNVPPPPADPEGLLLSSSDVEQIISHDPNSIIGPKGTGIQAVVPTTRPMPYSILFTNLPTAQAPAQQVVVQEQLDPGLDGGTFRLGSFGFAGQTYAVPANSSYYQTTIDLTQQYGFDVDVTATIDESTDVATWTFTTVDPATGQPPLNPTVGMLPPDTGNGIGEGFVSYVVEPLPTDPTGTVIAAQATVTFDTQPPLATPQIFNTLDTGSGLTSAVAALPAFETSSPFGVSWSGSDASDSAGISSYTIYVSDNGAPYTAWLTNTPLTSAPYAGQNGHTYAFYSVATDNAGNVQPTPGTAQATSTVDVTPPVTTAFSSPAAGGSYNATGWTGTLGGTAGDSISGVQQEQVSILDKATGEFWNGSSFSSSSAVFETATLANPGATSTPWGLSFPAGDFPADGSYVVQAVATDVAGNVESPGLSATFQYDTTPPVTTDSLAGTSGNNGWFRSAVQVTLSATDATSGVAATYYTIDGGTRETYTGSAFSVSGQGSHTIAFWSVDRAGNTEATETDTFKIDSVAPTTTDSLSGTHGSNGWFVSDTVGVTLTASDTGSGVAATYYTIDGGGQQTYTGSAFSVTGEGSHAIAFWSVDQAGNTESTESDRVKIDTVKPITTDSLSGTQGSNGWYVSATVGVTLTASDAGSPVAATYYTIDGGSQQTYAGSAFPVIGEGSHTMTFWSVDQAGSTESAESDSFQIDSVKPKTTDSLSGTQGSNGWFISASVGVTLTASDATSGVAATYYTIDGGAQQTYGGSAFPVSGQGSHAITFWSVDQAGNTEATESDTFKIDSVKPKTTDSLSGTQGNNGWYTSATVSVTLTASDATSGVTATYYTIDGGALHPYTGSAFSVSGEEGSHTITFWSVDQAGNTEAPKSDTFKIDSVKPTTTDSLSGTQGSNGWYTSASVSVTLTASDATSGVAATYYTIDGGAQQTYAGSAFSVSGQGSHTITFWSVDQAGNTETAELDSIKIDTIKPVTIDNLDSTGWYTSPSVSVTLTASDAISGVAATYYTLDGGSLQTYTGSPFSVTGEGTHSLVFWSVDVAGNTEAAESGSFRIDSIKPSTTDSLSGTRGTNGWFTSPSVSVTLTASDAISGVTATYYVIDGGSTHVYTDNPFFVSGEGTHHIAFWSVDAAGNTETAESDNIDIDSVKPVTTDSLSGTPGNNGWYTSATVSVTLTASDATSGVAATYYTIDGGAQQTYTGSAFPVSGQGSHAITFWSVDQAGNTEATETDSFKIDSVKPTTTDSLSGTQGNNGWFTSATVGVTLTASDAGSPVTATYYTIDGGGQQTYGGSAFSVTGQGSHTIAFWSVDQAGNTEATESDSFKIDSVKPTTTDSLSGTQGSNGWYTSASVSVTLTASDATSGVAATYYTLDGGAQQTYTGSAFPVSGQGSHTITFWSVDQAGNTEATETDSFKIDSVAPTTADSLSGTQGNNGWFVSATVGVTLTASDATSGVAATYYTIDGGAQQTYSGSAFPVSGQGNHTITFWSVDQAGNTESAESDSFQIDSVKPKTTDSLSGTLGNDGWYTSAAVSVTPTASDATSGVAATYYTIDGGGQQTYTGSAFSVSGDGTHHIAFWSVDQAGNTETAESDSFKIDSTRPTTTDSLAGRRGSNGWYTSATVGVTLTATDATSGVAATYYTLDGGSQQTYTGSAFSVSGQGSHTITFWSVDVAGNVEAAESDSFQIDSVAPTSAVSPLPAYTPSATFSVGWGGSDGPNGSGLATYTIYDSDDGGAFTAFQQNTAATSAPFTGLDGHTYVFYSLAADNAGNVQTVAGPSQVIAVVFPANHLVVQAPSQAVAGGAFTVTVNAENADGFTDPLYTGSVALRLGSAPSGGKLSGTTVATVQNGVATFSNLSLNVVGGGYKLFAASSTDLLTATSSPITVVPTTHFAISGVPATLTAGASFTITVTALTAAKVPDTTYAGTVRLTSTDSQASFLNGNEVTLSAGTGQATVTLKTAGKQTISAADVTKLGDSGPSSAVTVTAATLAGFRVTAYPSPDVSGVAHSVTVTAVDPYGNKISTYRGQVQLTSSDSQAVLPAPYTCTATDAGTHTFSSVILKTVGPQTLSATDTSNHGWTGTQSPITVLSPATSLSVTVSSPALTAGQQVMVTVTALYGSNQLDGQFSDTVQLSSSGLVAAGLPASYTFSAADDGRKSFSVTLDQAGSQTFTAADVTSGRTAIKGTSTAVTVTAAALAGFSVTAYPSPDVSGVAHSVTVTAVDPYGNKIGTYRGQVQLTSSDSQAVLPAPYTFTATDAGTHTFSSVILKTAGPQTLSATDTSNHAWTGTQSPPITVLSPATSLRVTVSSPALTAGQQVIVTVTALYGANQLDGQFSDTVQLSSSGLVAAGLPASYTFSAADDGRKSFNVTLDQAGSQTFTAADVTSGRTAIQGTSSSVVVSAAAAFHLQVAYPSPDLGGASHTFTVKALDPYNNVATTFRDTVALASSDPNRLLPVTSYTFTARDDGVHTFSATLNTLGLQSLTATDTTHTQVLPDSENIGVVTFEAGITPTSPATVPVLAVPGQPLAFSLSASETGQLAGTRFTYTVNWGDGSAAKPDTQTVSGVSGTPVSHVFTTTGTFTIAVTAADAAGNVTPQAATVAATLSTVALEADPGDATKTALFVGGTTGSDTITITPTNAAGTSVSVTVNKVAQKIGTATTFAPTGHILVYGQAGNDTIQETAATLNKQSVPVAVPALIFAGGGNDTLSVAGSSANNVLVGASGNDTLMGGAGRDVLIGGSGASALHAGSGGDVLIPGSTTYTPTVGGVANPNVPALLALLAEWGRNTTYVARVQDLFAGGSGSLNGSTLLNPSTVQLSTVLDQIFAGGASDWLWFADNKVVDQVNNLSGGSIATFE